MSNTLQGIVYLTPEQYEILVSEGAITANGKTISYNKNTLYITKAGDKLSNAEVLIGNTAPTTSTVAALGQLYLDTTDKKVYQCVAIDGDTYEWHTLGADGGNTIDLEVLRTEINASLPKVKIFEEE